MFQTFVVINRARLYLYFHFLSNFTWRIHPYSSKVINIPHYQLTCLLKWQHIPEFAAFCKVPTKERDVKKKVLVV